MGERAVRRACAAFRSRPICRPRKCSRCRTRTASNGMVRSSKPLSYGGMLDRELQRALRGRAHRRGRRPQRGQAVLEQLVETDAGAGAARRGGARAPQLARVAVRTCSSTTRSSTRTPRATSRSASAYKFTLSGGDAMSDEEFARAGGNRSAIARRLHDRIRRARRRRRAQRRPPRAAHAPRRMGLVALASSPAVASSRREPPRSPSPPSSDESRSDRSRRGP